MKLLRFSALLAAAFVTGSAQAEPPLKIERVVLLMRHGVRPPTKDPAMPEGIAADPWPSWTTKPGELTPHGAAAVRLLGAADRAYYVQAGLLPRVGCAIAADVASDSDQRTIATGDAYLAGFAPGCRIANRHKPQDVPDPLFLNAGENGAPFDPDRANRSVAATLGPGGIAAVERAHAELLGRVDRILCGDQHGGCGVRGIPSGLTPATGDKRPKLSGALDRASTVAQILLLEYVEGKPMTQVGWGRASAADVSALSKFHGTEFAILARPPYLAGRNAAMLARVIADALGNARSGAPKLVALVGHDTNVASLGGMLDLHWQAPGYAADDPPPGGAIMLELIRDRSGRRFVRARFRAQALHQLRTLKPGAAYRSVLTIGRCGTVCPLDRFLALLRPAD